MSPLRQGVCRQGIYRGRVESTATYATSGAYASSRDALPAKSDLRAYGPCQRRDGAEGNPEPTYRSYRSRTSTLSVAGHDLQEDGPRRRRWSQRDSHESVVGRRSSWLTRARATQRQRATGPTTTRPLGAGRRVSPEHGTRSCQASLDTACAGLLFD